ncbi:MAG TPA: mechanosensitive ion channel domain-containing protein [Bacteroidales bacterium]|nr:mechanosensitive ion channel domain-containing protein [Bacteroidales bacterium]
MSFEDFIGENLDLLIIIASSLIAALALYLLVIWMVKKYSHRGDNQLEKNVYKKFRAPVFITLGSLAVVIILKAMNQEQQVVIYFAKAINILIIFGITWLIVQLIGLGKFLILKRYDFNVKDNLRARKVFTQYKIIERVLVFIVILIALSIALMTFESIRKIGVSLFASAGVAGIIIGFAAQKMIGNVLAGIQLAIAQPIRLDDVVIVEGEWGWIEEITLTFVVVRIWDKRRLVVPTTHFIEKPFQNWTRESSDILGTVIIYADYTVPFDKVREELTRILKSDSNWDGKVNNLQVTNSTEKTVEIRALMSANDSPTAWDLRVNVREQLIKFLQKNYPDCLPRTRIAIKEK